MHLLWSRSKIKSTTILS